MKDTGSNSKVEPGTAYILLIPILGRQRHVDGSEFEASLVYLRRSKPAKVDNDTLSQINKVLGLSVILM